MQLLPTVLHYYVLLSFVKLQGCSSTSTRYVNGLGNRNTFSVSSTHVPLVPVSPIPRAHMNTSSLIKKSRDFLKVKEGDSRNPPCPGHGGPPATQPLLPFPNPLSRMGILHGSRLWEVDGGKELGDFCCIFYSVGRKLCLPWKNSMLNPKQWRVWFK